MNIQEGQGLGRGMNCPSVFYSGKWEITVYSVRTLFAFVSASQVVFTTNYLFGAPPVL